MHGTGTQEDTRQGQQGKPTKTSNTKQTGRLHQTLHHGIHHKEPERHQQQEAPSPHLRGDSDNLPEAAREITDTPTEAHLEEVSPQVTTQEAPLHMEEARLAAIQGAPRQAAAGLRGATAHPAMDSRTGPLDIQVEAHRTEDHQEVRGDITTWTRKQVC